MFIIVNDNNYHYHYITLKMANDRINLDSLELKIKDIGFLTHIFQISYNF